MSKTVVHEIDPAQTHGFESITGDRPYTSELFTKLHNALSLGGYASNDAGHLDVFATGTDKIVTVQTGTAFVAGHFLELKNTHDISLNDAPAGQIRWDLIAIRIDRASAERKISIIKVEGNATATDDNSSIPWDQLQTDELLLGSGIFEFPIAAVKTSGTANITVDRILKTLPSVNPLEPMYVFLDDTLGSSVQIGGRVLIPNEPPANTPHEITLRVRIPKTTSTKELALVINDFLGADNVIPLKDETGAEIFANTVSEKSFEITINAEKTEAVISRVLDVYNVQPLTSQIVTMHKRLDLSSELLNDVVWHKTVVHNNKVFFINTRSNHWMIADTDNDGNMTNFQPLDLSAELSVSPSDNWYGMLIHNGKAIIINREPRNWVIADIDNDGNLSNFSLTDYSAGMPGSTTLNNGISIIGNKCIISSDKSEDFYKCNINENGALTNFEKLDLSSYPDFSKEHWTGNSIINDTIYFHNTFPQYELKGNIDTNGIITNIMPMTIKDEGFNNIAYSIRGFTILKNKILFSGEDARFFMISDTKVELVETFLTRGVAEGRYALKSGTP